MGTTDDNTESIDYDNPGSLEPWFIDQRTQVEDYLSRQDVQFGQTGDGPAWYLAPYISLWAIESRRRPGWVGWWVICGDLPTDYISSNTAKTPRQAIRKFAETWAEVAGAMIEGKEHPEITIGRQEDQATLGPLLGARAELLRRFADEQEIWDVD